MTEKIADRSPQSFVCKFEQRASWVIDPPGISMVLTVAITQPPKRKNFVVLMGNTWPEVCEQLAMWIEAGCPSMEELKALPDGEEVSA